ncbi:MAG TPA: malto-oligosyltrehalose synthase, partial [Blastocatellia bacterium]|nr:malto-oligosyltrehalose synthase [Blastocatellia bacterium]
ACYVIVEKILGRDEELRPDWDLHGTTGYEALNLLNGVFVEAAGRAAFDKLYERFTRRAENFGDLVYRCKKLILRVAMSSELHVLARRLERIAEQHRYTRDFTLNSLQYTLGEVIACFPVYRSYTRGGQAEVGTADRRHITAAIREAKRRNPATAPSVFDFIGALLLLEDPEGLDGGQRGARREFVLRFQQLTGPVMAKGLEDTACYRRYPLASLNEVGGEPERFGVAVEDFHRENERRLAAWPHGLVATSTHDTKRGEDVRARINVLSEMPARWYRAARRWQNLNLAHKTRLDGGAAPDANEEYLFYQTLVGAWPLDPPDEVARAEFVTRIEEYLVKAIKEAKLHSSWISPHEEYERAAREFVRAALAPGPENRFLAEFAEFHAPVARAGVFNSLAQTLLKITVPGVPDFYQGSELWDFNLVDPDNRRPVDYALRQGLLSSLGAEENGDAAALVERLAASPGDGRLKLYLTSRALAFRGEARELFDAGTYVPLRAEGGRDHHVVAFARAAGGRAAVVAVGRFFSRLEPAIGGEAWGGTELALGNGLASGEYREVLTGKVVGAAGGALPLGEVFAHLPVALLERR